MEIQETKLSEVYLSFSILYGEIHLMIGDLSPREEVVEICFQSGVVRKVDPCSPS